ncbi:nuclear transport factor 2 family protein [Leptolyngbya sp. 7M]|uniref:nuclear transport factor 2 family protein n=1 Tax=Leptolyngbya sp. 7M TaxID=2812896 RepID=UPI001B8CB3D5|nr:nuclear transport factor 2 family protein [Leptolyngbya sp. 7M]QYO66953.1 nuclear transport factor 2 family protein [Leptolyngbya sp. 7M]
MKTQDLLTEAYTAFNNRDIDAVLTVMHPDVQWANGMEGGHIHGREAVRDYWIRQWNSIDPQVNPQGFRSDENGQIVVDVHQVVRNLDGNLLLDQIVQHVYTFEDGLIQRMDITGL